MLLADRVIKRLSEKIQNNYYGGHIKTVLELICVKARLLYVYNQEYKDDQSEELLTSISDMYKGDFSHEGNDDTVLFYDGFGLDTRGLVQQYLLGLITNNYKVLYITAATDKSQQPQVAEILDKGEGSFFCADISGIEDKICWMRNFCSIYKFSTAFMYTTPWDVAGIVTFNMLKDSATRYQINLTDHAFWLGINAFDYCLEFRNYGAAITRDYRGVDEHKLVQMPYYPVLNASIVFQGFPKMCKGKKVVFSGGAPYKTVDADNTFYKLVAAILDKHEDVVFIYAGDGTVEGLDHLIKQYPERALHIYERKDLIKVMEHSRLFLNTYPISGALMLQYAAVAGCIPVTLKRKWDEDADGLLLDEERLQETFTDYSEILKEIDRLIDDEAYLRFKKEQLRGQVITASEFAERLKCVLGNPDKMLFSSIDKVDTLMYRKSYDKNMSEKAVVQNVIQKDCLRVWKYFPGLVLKRMLILKKELKNAPQ